MTNSSADWQIINDGVMGGASRSEFRVSNDLAIFQGEVSLANNGGFASVRSVPAHHDLMGCNAFRVRVRGDGRRYKLTGRMELNLDRAIYQMTFPTQPGEWTEHQLSLNQFVPTFRGRVLAGEPPLAAAKVASVGFLISEKQAGPFRLEIAWIKAVSQSWLMAARPATRFPAAPF